MRSSCNKHLIASNRASCLAADWLQWVAGWQSSRAQPAERQECRGAGQLLGFQRALRLLRGHNAPVRFRCNVLLGLDQLTQLHQLSTAAQMLQSCNHAVMCNTGWTALKSEPFLDKDASPRLGRAFLLPRQAQRPIVMQQYSLWQRTIKPQP